MTEPAKSDEKIPQAVLDAVLVQSSAGSIPEGTPIVKGYDWGPLGSAIDYEKLFQSYLTTGLQASNVGLAIERINEMIKWRYSDVPVTDDDDMDMEERKKIRCKIFLGYTSNMISCGIRETLLFLVKNKMVDVIVTSAGGVEEDFMKCFAPAYMGEFTYKGSELRKKGLNRIGNMLVPNDNYCGFENWMMPILDQMLEEQKTQGTIWSPSKMINRFGKEIKNEESVYYWCWKNDIPVFCPAITDGSIGDMIYFHSYKNPGLIVDIAQDIRAINSEAAFAKQTGMLIIGGGTVKHHICNANLMRNGANYSVYVNTGSEYDGSDSGASPDEAVSWGKIRMDAKPVKIAGEASIVLPIIVSQTFAKNFEPKE